MSIALGNNAGIFVFAEAINSSDCGYSDTSV